MQRNKLKVLLIIFCLYAPMSTMAGPIKVLFDHPVEILTPTNQGLGTPVNHEANKEISLPADQVLWVQSKGFVPVLMLPQSVAIKGEALKIKMPPVASWPNLETQNEIDRKLSLITDEVVSFQAAIRSRNVGEAERILARMEGISQQDYYHFFRASIQFLKGDVDAAKDSTKRGLSRFPANEKGQKFLQTLEKKGQ